MFLDFFRFNKQQIQLGGTTYSSAPAAIKRVPSSTCNTPIIEICVSYRITSKDSW
jgi:hypothetical protein